MCMSGGAWRSTNASPNEPCMELPPTIRRQESRSIQAHVSFTARLQEKLSRGTHRHCSCSENIVDSLSLQYNTVNPYSRAAEGLVKPAARCSGSKLEGIDREMSRKGCCHKGLNDTSSLTTTSSSSTLRREHDFALRQDVDANAWAEGQAAKTVRVRGFSNRTKPRKIRSVSYLDPRETNIGFRRSTSARYEKPLRYSTIGRQDVCGPSIAMEMMGDSTRACGVRASSSLLRTQGTNKSLVSQHVDTHTTFWSAVRGSVGSRYDGNSMVIASYSVVLQGHVLANSIHFLSKSTRISRHLSRHDMTIPLRLCTI